MTSIQGVTLELDNKHQYLCLKINSSEVAGRLDSKTIIALFKESQFATYLLNDEGILSGIARFNEAKNKQQHKVISEVIAEKKDAEVRLEIADDLMSAKLFIVAPFGGDLPTLVDLKKEASRANIIRGLSLKRMKKLLREATAASPGEIVDGLIAKGLPPRNGRNSRSKTMVQNALERILRPQNIDGDKVDMRNLGEIMCVKPGQALLKRLPPTPGRTGFNITGQPLKPEPGEWIEIYEGSGTRIDSNDHNSLVADISGMPKYKEGQMSVDNTYISKGVNVGTGNIKYAGAVLVNGDVTEKMRIEAIGDVTINGFVESAFIKSGGDIIITQGASGKVNEDLKDYSTRLEAQGSIFIQHGQGLDIVCKGDVSLGKQLAYSRIKCGGSVTVGLGKQATGNLFSCEVTCQGAVKAGKIGAVSGSQVIIDFSQGLNLLIERKETIDELITQIESHIGRHREKIDRIKNAWCPDELALRRNDILERFQDEHKMYQWLLFKANELQDEKNSYTDKIGAEASKRLYPGVMLRLNGKTWRADREYSSAKLKYEGHNWHQDVI